ncbi:hypothetical protein BP5796_10956 [Coleophoma crateriformis]|uniref:Uncharacterized protein n=1 Tax=Coleophoma crateriformis TaxID=565419 RepID=A0A3D8QMG6_9HELO|nr:hypothetical protein BP5796_10956 [Coleophoma crateriformis]
MISVGFAVGRVKLAGANDADRRGEGNHHGGNDCEQSRNGNFGTYNSEAEGIYEACDSPTCLDLDGDADATLSVPYRTEARIRYRTRSGHMGGKPDELVADDVQSPLFVTSKLAIVNLISFGILLF